VVILYNRNDGNISVEEVRRRVTENEMQKGGGNGEGLSSPLPSQLGTWRAVLAGFEREPRSRTNLVHPTALSLQLSCQLFWFIRSVRFSLESSKIIYKVSMWSLTGKRDLIGLYVRLRHFINGNALHMRSGGIITIRMAFPRVPPPDDRWLHCCAQRLQWHAMPTEQRWPRSTRLNDAFWAANCKKSTNHIALRYVVTSLAVHQLPVWALGLKELTRSVSWPDVIQGD